MDLITVLSPRVRWHQVVRTIVDHKLAIVLAAVLDGECPDVGVVDQAVAANMAKAQSPLEHDVGSQIPKSMTPFLSKSIG
jgi:hypothetical protein